ncbi:VWA domain-containing protein [Methylobacterium aquaticum]|uniref:VWA domain-containing protein n=1 Tax=Methylobacterium aquaticum TaxID=270351 RepID=UPI003D181056
MTAIRRALALLLLVPLAWLTACGRQPLEVVIASGSENRTLEPIVQDFCRDRSVTCRFAYQGSLDIGLALAKDPPDMDVVWPANAIWIELFDRDKRVRDLTPVARSPVILGLRRSRAAALGWVGRPVATSEIVAAVRDKKLTYLASSATQSNSGAGAYLAMLSAALGSPDAMTLADLRKPGLQDTVRTLLSGTARTAGSSAWLADLYLKGLEGGTAYDGMWNYEAVLAETNAELTRRGAEPLYAIYPSDGVAAANSPLGFVDRGKGAEARAFFDALLKHMLSPEVQGRLVALGRRPAIGEATGAAPDPSWNYDPARLVPLIRMPEPAVVRAALDLYQEALRRPSLTVYCLDFSGSMGGRGETELKAAMRFVLSHDEAAQVLVQNGPGDRIVVIPFDAAPRSVTRATGAAADAASLVEAVEANRAGGGTDIYACAAAGLREIRATPDLGRYLPAIVLMTDGRSEDRQRDFLTLWRATGADIPVFGVTFGDADATQLDTLAEATRARVFDGRRSLREAFRAVRGYN